MNIFWMLLSTLLLSTMTVCVKLAGSHFNLGQTVFARGFVPVLMIGGWIALQRFSLRTPHWRSHLHRSVAGTLGMLLYFSAIALLPLAAAVTLNNTSALFMAGILSCKRRPPVLILFSLCMGLIGVGLILQPSLSAEQWLGGVLGLTSGLLACIAQLNLRELGQAGEPEWRTVFFFSSTCSIAAIPFALLLPHGAINASTPQLGFLIGVGILGGVAQLALSRAYASGRILVTASLGYLTVVFSSLYGVLLLGDRLDALSWLGILTVILACLVTTHPRAWHNTSSG